ncbi:waprin-Enh1-like [Rhineura floridana]|uniref:waprin-Enh1-like n=1 Tax=Rhineura floridana TaxID=261503 RepID=UPI002AC7E7A2|nr:waprin-Enh1-like [Rhineura floridana]
MKTPTVLLLVGLLALWTELPSTTCLRNPRGLPRLCPGNAFRCPMLGIDRCRSNIDCPQNLRCCNYRCARFCKAPPVVPWICPQNPIKCAVPGIDRCRIDNDCPGRQRCCYYNCARSCR